LLKLKISIKLINLYTIFGKNLKQENIMKRNYFTIHQNKKPKKIKYSKIYSKEQQEKIRKLNEFWRLEIEKLKQIL